MLAINASARAGGLILRDDKPLLWQFDGGYVELNDNGTPTSWNYYVTDHLGSTRKVVDSNNNVKETINYYPFGSEMKMQDPAQMAGDTWQPYRFTSKELDNQNGLNWYDFGARWFDVAGVPMWTSVDPLAEKNPSLTPYHFCHNDPVNRIDPDGNDDWDIRWGHLIGAATNIIPFSSAIRDMYTPTDASDYNNALRNTDNAFLAIGNSMSNAGKGSMALGTAVAATGGAIIVGSGGTAVVAGASTSLAGAALTGVSASAGAVGTLMQMNAANNRNGGYNRGKNTDSSKNERHGDAGRGQTKADKRLSDLQNRLSNATSKKEKMEIKRTMRHIKEDAERKRHGEEHSRGNKR